MNFRWLWFFLFAAGISGDVIAQPPALQHVENQFHIVTANERTTLNRLTGELISTVDVRLFNLGGRSLQGPMHLVVRTTGAGVVVTGSLGGTNDPLYNAHYLDLSSQLTGNRLLAGQTLDTTLEFRRPRSVEMSYTLEPRALLEEEREPSLTIFPFSSPIQENELLIIRAEGGDPDGDVVVLSAEPAISNATFSATSGVAAAGTFVFAPTNGQAGIYTLRFTARDPLGLVTSSVVQVEVLKSNRGPSVGEMSPRALTVGDALLVNISADDPDGDALALNAEPIPAGAIFSPETKTFLFTPDATQTGVFNIGFAASDGALTSPTQYLEVTVSPLSFVPVDDTNQLTLVVDPIQSPTLVARQRVTGFVNVGTNAEPRPMATSALITGLNPATVTVGDELDLEITGQPSGLFEAHFSEASQVLLGPGINVLQVTAQNPHLLTARIRVLPDAAQGPRGVTVATSNETAISIVALNVGAGTTEITGTLIDSITSNAVAGAIITVQGTGFTATTNPDGTFSILGVPPGEHTLIINGPNHQLLRFQINTAISIPLQLGAIQTAPTVFDPNAPASVSLLSVLGRRLGALDGIADLDKLRQTIRDAFLLVGGWEFGIVDEFGNQANPEITDHGPLSITEDGIRQLAERTARGDTFMLGDILMMFSFALEWSEGAPPTLAEWIDGMQQLLNAAWANPNAPENYLPILMFSREARLTPDPPTLSPLTALNASQAFLCTASLWSYVFSIHSPFAALPATDKRPIKSVSSLLGEWAALFAPAAYADDPPPPPPRFTQYWRNFNNLKNNFVQGQVNNAFQGFIDTAIIMTAMTVVPDLRGQLIALPILGHVANDIATAFTAIKFASIVPGPPTRVGAELIFDEDGAPRVEVRFRRSSSDLKDGNYIYALYRFRRPNEPRVLVAISKQDQAPGNDLVLVDRTPIAGTFFYALTLTRTFTVNQTLSEDELQLGGPWWNYPLSGVTDPFQIVGRSKRNLTSDFSDPAVVFVGPPTHPIAVTELGVDPATGDIYYADRTVPFNEQKFVRIRDGGDGERSVLAHSGFASPGHKGLAVSSGGHLFSGNAASEALFGGRLFRFSLEGGARQHVGQINYFSRDLQFANPVSGGPMDMGPSAIPGIVSVPEDLYLVDHIAEQVKRAPVYAGFDPYRIVAQPYADFFVSGQARDLKVDDNGNAFLLIDGAFPRSIQLSKFHPDEVKGGDPVDLHSGSFSMEAQDMFVLGRMGMEINRQYNSLHTNAGAFGIGWDYGYNVSAVETQDAVGATHVLIDSGMGVAYDFVERADGSFETPAGWLYDLERTPTGFRLSDRHGNAMLFHADGLLTAIADPSGYELQMVYGGSPSRLQQIHDGQGHSLSFSYNAAGLISEVSDHLGSRSIYSYDAQDRLIGVVNPVGATVAYTYDASNRLASIANDKGVVWLVNEYDNQGRVKKQFYNDGWFHFDYQEGFTTVTDRRGFKHTQVYTPEGSLARLVDTLGRETTYERDLNLNVTRVILPDGAEIVSKYDERSRLTRTVNAEGGAYEFEYEAALDKVTLIRDPLGRETRYHYDGDGNLTNVIDALGLSVSYAYNADRQVTRITDPAGSALHLRYSSSGLMTQIHDTVRGVTTSIRDDGEGEFVISSSATTNATRFTYDALHRITQVDAFDGLSHMSYDGFDNITNVAFASGESVRLGYDEFGRVQSFGQSEGGAIELLMEPGGRHAGIVMPEGLTSFIHHDAMGRVTNIVDLAGNHYVYEYNARDQLTRAWDANGNASVFEYDVIGRLKKNTGFDGTVEEFTYDLVGAMTSMSNNRGFSATMSRDAVNRLTNITYSAPWPKAVAYEYDILGRIRSRVESDHGATAYAYTPAGEWTVLTNAFGQRFEAVYNARGLRERVRYPNGVETLYFYSDNSFALPERVDHVNSNGVLLARTAFAYDGTNQVIRLTDEDGGDTVFAFEAGRLVSVNFPNGDVDEYVYDALARRIRHVHNGTTNHYVYDAAGRLLSAGNVTFSYDANGNMIRREEGASVTEFAYDFNHRLIEVTHPSGETSTYTYGPLGARASRTHDGATTWFFHDGVNLLEERNGDGDVLVRYTYSVYGDEPLSARVDGTDVFYHRDGLDNIAILTDAEGNVVKRYTYDAFGQLRNQTGSWSNRLRYIAREFDDETGLYYLRHRYYDPSIGQFITPEPSRRSLLSYVYAGHNPVTFKDPNGLAPVPRDRNELLHHMLVTTPYRTRTGMAMFFDNLPDHYFPKEYTSLFEGKPKVWQNHYNGQGLLRVVNDNVQVRSDRVVGAYRWVHVDTTHGAYAHIHIPTSDLVSFLQERGWWPKKGVSIGGGRSLGPNVTGYLSINSMTKWFSKNPQATFPRLGEFGWLNLNPLHAMPYPRALGTQAGLKTLANAAGVVLMVIPVVDAAFIQQTPEKKALAAAGGIGGTLGGYAFMTIGGVIGDGPGAMVLGIMGSAYGDSVSRSTVDQLIHPYEAVNIPLGALPPTP